MFSEFRFKNFKSFRDSTLPVEPVTLVIGANASGKSNALEGIHVLSQLAKPLKVEDILDGVRGQLPGIRGGSQGASFSGKNKFELGCTFFQNDVESIYDVEIASCTPEIMKEHLRFTGEFSNTKLKNLLTDNSPTKNQPYFISLLSSEKRNTEKQAKVQTEFPKELIEALEKIFIFNPSPSLMKEYVNIKKHRLLPNAENISAVIAKLIQDQQQKKVILDTLQDFPEQQIIDIDVIQTPTDDVMLKLIERIGQQKISFDARGLSDGTLRVLAITAALLSEPEGTTLVIEEIDNGLHPARVQKLMDFLSGLSRQRQIDIIATTHNPAMLNAVPKQDMPGVVVCYRDPQDGDSRFIRWMDVPSYPELMAVGRIGDLMTKGLIEKATHESPVDYQKQIQQKQQWIEEELE